MILFDDFIKDLSKKYKVQERENSFYIYVRTYAIRA